MTKSRQTEINDSFLLIIDKIINKWKADGTMKRILEYNTILEERDVKNELVVDMLRKKTQYKPEFRHSLETYLMNCSKETVTRLIKSGAKSEGIVRENDGIELSDIDYSRYKARLKYLNMKSRKKILSFEGIKNEDDERDFLEKYNHENYACYSEYLHHSGYDPLESLENAEQEEERENTDTVLDLIKHLRMSLKQQNNCNEMCIKRIKIKVKKEK